MQKNLQMRFQRSEPENNEKIATIRTHMLSSSIVSYRHNNEFTTKGELTFDAIAGFALDSTYWERSWQFIFWSAFPNLIRGENHSPADSIGIKQMQPAFQ